MGRAAEAISDMFAEAGQVPNFKRPAAVARYGKPQRCFYCETNRPRSSMKPVEGVPQAYECRTVAPCEQRIVASWAGVQG